MSPKTKASAAAGSSNRRPSPVSAHAEELGDLDEEQLALLLELRPDLAEPAPASMDLIEKLADEYEIALAIHNHPKPSSVYWDPAKVVEVTKGRSKRMGACCDTGHWVRSGLAPVECLKKLEGRIIGMHLKDITEFGVVNAPDVPWGTGKGQIAAILAEVRRQKAKPVFAIEYERHGDTMPDLRQSIAFYEKTAQE